VSELDLCSEPAVNWDSLCVSTQLEQSYCGVWAGRDSVDNPTPDAAVRLSIMMKKNLPQFRHLPVPEVSAASHLSHARESCRKMCSDASFLCQGGVRVHVSGVKSIRFFNSLKHMIH
jgi:hypothetical protein